jgi:hypothetical protein
VKLIVREKNILVWKEEREEEVERERHTQRERER